MKGVTVVGSINLDTTYTIPRIPEPGETIHVEGVSSAAGGKGANQAVAAQRSGIPVTFIGSVGNDQGGKQMLKTLKEEGINVDHIIVNQSVETGAASILLDDKGQNSILVDAGANGKVTPEQVKNAEDNIAQSKYVIAQFETPIAATKEAFKIAKKHGVKTILNPAPARKIDDELLNLTDVITPNETESYTITGIRVDTQKGMIETAGYFGKKGVAVTLITLGEKGVFYSFNKDEALLKANKVDVVDTTGAGDTFIGAMASTLKPDFSNLKEAINYGQRASSITVQGKGAQPSIPTREKVEKIYGREN